jgi:hypothetical protein
LEKFRLKLGGAAHALNTSLPGIVEIHRQIGERFGRESTHIWGAQKSGTCSLAICRTFCTVRFIEKNLPWRNPDFGQNRSKKHSSRSSRAEPQLPQPVHLLPQALAPHDVARRLLPRLGGGGVAVPQALLEEGERRGNAVLHWKFHRGFLKGVRSISDNVIMVSKFSCQGQNMVFFAS